VIRVALVGAGGMARQYRAVYARLPQVKFVLAVDVDDEPLLACRALGVERTSRRFADALADDIDMLDISTPNHLHEEQAVAALAAGKHVLLQKPIANSLEAADRIVAAARAARGTLGMYMFSYANPWFWAIKRLLDDGALGAIQSVRCRDAHRGGLRAPADAWRASRDKTGGGSFTQLSIHGINLTQWWLGRRIDQVMAWSDNQYCPNVGGDDVTVAIVRFDGPNARMPASATARSLYGVFDSGWASDVLTREIYGTAGWARYTEHGNALEVQLDAPHASPWLSYDTPGEVRRFLMPPPRWDDVSSPLNPHRVFVERLAAQQEPLMTAEHGRRDLAVVMAAYESARTGRAAHVSQA